MADEHRRVEPRGVVGSGMLTDPERIDQLTHERDRSERTWREAPKRKFGEVLTEAPARSPEEEEAAAEAQRALEERRRRRGEKGAEERASSESDAASGTESDKAAPAPVEIAEAKPLPRVPPDPRMARLHGMLPSSRGRKGS